MNEFNNDVIEEVVKHGSGMRELGIVIAGSMLIGGLATKFVVTPVMNKLKNFMVQRRAKNPDNTGESNIGSSPDENEE